MFHSFPFRGSLLAVSYWLPLHGKSQQPRNTESLVQVLQFFKQRQTFLMEITTCTKATLAGVPWLLFTALAGLSSLWKLNKILALVVNICQIAGAFRWTGYSISPQTGGILVFCEACRSLAQSLQMLHLGHNFPPTNLGHNSKQQFLQALLRHSQHWPWSLLVKVYYRAVNHS